MGKNCPIMTRIKENYESRSRTYLTRRTPVIIRLDGKAFHTYTKGLDKPFDEGLISDMEETTKFLCENIQGVRIGYCQSDEISLLLTDYEQLDTQAWFDYNVQKVVSISASMATAKFNELRAKRGIEKLAYFDSRVFSIPKEEICNYFKARQRDAVKNSISMLAQSLYSHKELHGKNSSDKQEMCFQKGHNWNDLDYRKKRGCTVRKFKIVNNVVLNYIPVNGEYDSIEENEEVKIGDLWYLPESNRLLEYSKDVSRGDIEYDDWVEISIEKMRNKWLSIETPLNFDNEFFKEFY